MTRIWPWLARHPSLVKLLSGALAAVLLVGGVIAGFHQAPTGSRAGADLADLEAQTVATRVPAKGRVIVGVVRAVGPSAFLVRGPRGSFFAVRWGPNTQFRAAKRAISPTVLRNGDRVVILGSPAADGSMQASLVTVAARGAARSATPASQPDAPGVSPPAGGS